jgi:hypothetical protein
MAVHDTHPHHSFPRLPHALVRAVTVAGIVIATIVVAVVLAYILWVFGIILVKAVNSLPLGQ